MIRRVIKEELKPINSKLDVQGERLDAQGKKVDILWDQVEKVTIGLDEVNEKLDSQVVVLKRIEQKVDKNSDDSMKLDKRLTKVENHLGIAPPPELTLFR